MSRRLALAGLVLALVIWLVRARRSREPETPVRAETSRIQRTLATRGRWPATNDAPPVARPPRGRPDAPLAPDEERRLLCALKAARPSAPWRGPARVHVVTSDDARGRVNVAWIKAEACPAGTYSIVYFDDEGHALDELDCRRATFTQLAVLSGQQAEIIDATPDRDGLDVAISGAGYFVLECDANLVLTRDGHFARDGRGRLVDGSGCTVLADDGKPATFAEVNRAGCGSDGRCLALADPLADDVGGLRHVKAHRFEADHVVPRAGRPRDYVVLSGALEDIGAAGAEPTSVVWSDRPVVNLEELRCER